LFLQFFVFWLVCSILSLQDPTVVHGGERYSAHEQDLPRVKWATPTNEIFSRVRTFSLGPFQVKYTFWKVFFSIQFASSRLFQRATGWFFVEFRSIKVSHVLLFLWLVPSHLTCLLYTRNRWIATSKGMGVYRSSAALIEWSDIELNDVKWLCDQAYKNAWHLQWSMADAPFIFPKAQAGKESTLLMVELPEKLFVYADRSMRHEDVVKKILLAGLNNTSDKWLCDSFAELIEKMEMWPWDYATGDFWTRLAKALHQSNISCRQSSWTAPQHQYIPLEKWAGLQQLGHWGNTKWGMKESAGRAEI